MLRLATLDLTNFNKLLVIRITRIMAAKSDANNEKNELFRKNLSPTFLGFVPP